MTFRKSGYCKLKEEELDCALWRTFCGRGYGPVIRKTEWMNACLIGKQSLIFILISEKGKIS